MQKLGDKDIDMKLKACIVAFLILFSVTFCFAGDYWVDGIDQGGYKKDTVHGYDFVTKHSFIGQQVATQPAPLSGYEKLYFKPDGILYQLTPAGVESVVGGAAFTPAALTKTDDTNVIVTLGGSPLTALLQPISLTFGWAGTLASNRITGTLEGKTLGTSSSPTVDIITKGPWVDVRAYGAHADGDDTTSEIQAALDTLISTVFVPDGTWMIQGVNSNGGPKGLYIHSNQTLLLSKGAILKEIANSSEHSTVVQFQSVSNAQIIGGTVQGERATHTGSTGEWGHGIMVWHGTDITIQGVLAKDCWGDGVWVGYTGTGLESSNVTISGCKITNNRRNNISVVGCYGGLISKNIIYNANGTNPESGIIIEPDSGYFVLNIKTDGNLIYGNNGHGVGGDFTHPGLGAYHIDVINNTIYNNGGYGIVYSYISDGTISNNTLYSNTAGNIGLLNGSTPTVINQDSTGLIIKTSTGYIYPNSTIRLPNATGYTIYNAAGTGFGQLYMSAGDNLQLVASVEGEIQYLSNTHSFYNQAGGTEYASLGSTGLNLSSLTASLPIFTDASKNLITKSVADAQTALGLVIGTNVQAYNASLAAIAAGTWTGASSITTLGTIATGVWQGTAIDHTYLTGIAQADVSGLTTGSSPIFVTVKCSALTDNYLPYHVSDTVGLANSGISVSTTIAAIITGPGNTSADSALSVKNSDGIAFFGVGDSGYIFFGPPTGSSLPVSRFLIDTNGLNYGLQLYTSGALYTSTNHDFFSIYHYGEDVWALQSGDAAAYRNIALSPLGGAVFIGATAAIGTEKLTMGGDIAFNLATKGPVLKDTQSTPHYWRVTVSTLGVLTTTDLGTGIP